MLPNRSRRLQCSSKGWIEVMIAWTRVVLAGALRQSAIVGFCLTCIVLVATTVSVLAAELQHLAATHLGADQGVFVEAENGTILVAQQEARPVHPASVTKVATTLALLETLGDQHRFETTFLRSGPIIDGSLDGDLVVRATGDPFFTFENAFLMLRRLHQLGLREVKGNVRVEGPLIFNWKADPEGQRLKRALQGLDGREAWTAIGEPIPQLGAVALRFLNKPSEETANEPMVQNQSPPLTTIVKALNGYSNNVFHLVSDRIGGPHSVELGALRHLPAAFSSEITITNAAGAGESNRLSPRAAVAILWELRKEMRIFGKDLPSVLPVNGFDAGTLKNRLSKDRYRGCIVGKTGTFGSVGASALVGVLRSGKYGHVAFAILNSGVPVPEARQRQDAFLRALIDAIAAKPWTYAPREMSNFKEARVN
jgi:D-alanyl-D-alanine carboxypeptidase/D-alanyl-D-alanine-endopeptidase (penicillin-binding protein 4)